MPGRARREAVSEATTHRLSLLLRGLKALEEEGVGTVSSQVLAARLGLGAAQIRKDLARFGEFGVRGVGYGVADLKERIRRLLGLSTPRALVVVGAGNLGLALADSRNFNSDGLEVVALFDSDRRKVGGRSRTGVPIRSASEIAETVAGTGAEIALLAVPADEAPGVAARLAAAGIRALVNFTAAALPPMPRLMVRNVDLTLFVEGLTFHLSGGDAALRPAVAPVR